MRRLAHVETDILRAGIAERVTFADAPHRHGAVKAQIALSLIAEANVVARQALLQQWAQRLQNIAVQRFDSDKRAVGLFLIDLPQQIG